MSVAAVVLGILGGLDAGRASAEKEWGVIGAVPYMITTAATASASDAALSGLVDRVPGIGSVGVLS